MVGRQSSEARSSPGIYRAKRRRSRCAPVNSFNYYSALRQAGTPAEMIVLPDGGHGRGFNPSSPHHSTVVESLRSFLTRR